MSTNESSPDAETARLNALAEEIPIDSIVIGERIRRDFSHVPSLADSIKEDGLIQPIVITYDRRLIAGESRIRAHRLLGRVTIRAVYRAVLDDAQLGVLEASENTARQNLTWQERILSVDKVHRIRSTQAVLSGQAWGVRETGALLNQSKSNIGVAVMLAEYLHANDKAVWDATSPADAYSVLCKRKLAEAEKALVGSVLPGTATKYVGKPTAPAAPAVPALNDGDFFTTVGPSFVPGVSGPEETDEVPGQPSAPLVVPLTKMLVHADAVTWLKDQPAGSFDHCITDWPYGIDMEMLNAQNQHGGLKDLDKVVGEHGVAENEALHAAILPEVYRTLRPGGFFITWTDFMQWQRGYDLAVAAGFKVQRWPLVWHKTSSCMNQTAQYNFTKNFEIAMVCRKEGATLIKPQSSSVWTGGNDVEAKALGHPFAKPFGLWNWLYDAVTMRGQHVLEPFAGRGSAVIPALRRGLKVTALETNEAHYNALVVNVSNMYHSIDPRVTFQ